MNKKIIFLIGGLGNQIWIWNHIYNIHKESKLTILDISWFKWYSKFFFNYRRISRQSHHKILSQLKPEIKIEHSPIRLLNFQINTKFKKLNKSLSEDYYFQNENQINSDFKEKFSDYLAKYFVEILEKGESIDIKDLKSSIGVHIRLGDRGQLTKKAINQVKSKLKLINKNSKIYLFSDQKDLAKEIISEITKNSIIQLETHNELLDFCCLSLCKNIIETRKSSYSFWARELSLSMRSKI